MKRREHRIKVTINDRKIVKVIIDPHFELKHAESIDDQIILSLIGQLDGKRFEPDDQDGAYLYFVTDRMVLNGKKYKLIWLLEDNKLYVGVVNAYRR